MTLEVQGPRVFATGAVGDDLRKFEEAFAKPGVDTVVFVNSPGGDLWTGLRVGRLIADKGFKTVVAGYCNSACSVMFMGGRERRYSDALPPSQTYIAIHGAHEQTTRAINPIMQPQLFAFYKQHMGSRFNSTIMNQALYDMEDETALLTVRDPLRSARSPPRHCRSAQTPRERCTEYPSETALTLGIATHADLVPLELPAAMRPSLLLLNREPPPEAINLPGLLTDLGERLCATAACKDNLKPYAGLAQHRALAIGVGETIVNWSHGLDTLNGALAVAVYYCNHMRPPTVRLCEAELLDNRPMRSLYRDAEAADRDALANLKPPKDRFYANEEFGGNFVSASGLRTERLADMTPSRLDGVRTLGTQELARWLIGEQRPVLVDTDGLFETIPGAVSLLGAGNAYPDATKDAALAGRVGRLLALLAPDKAAPVVFFGLGRNNWRAVNAALRARHAGYAQVLWYRGGIEAWMAAGLPTVQGSVRAVAD